MHSQENCVVQTVIFIIFKAHMKASEPPERITTDCTQKAYKCALNSATHISIYVNLQSQEKVEALFAIFLFS